MDKESYSWGGIGFLALFFLIIVAVWNRGGSAFGGYGGTVGGVGVPGYGLGFEDYKAICNAEKQGLINTANTQYLIEQQGGRTREVVTATSNRTQEKIDFYAYQGLRDKLADEQRKVMSLENQLFIKDQLAPVNAELAAIHCKMLKQPEVVGCATSCNPIYTPWFYNNGCNSCNGYNPVA